MKITRILSLITFLATILCLSAQDNTPTQSAPHTEKETNDSISEKNLDEVMVVGQTVERRGDKERVTITANMRKGVSNIMEMLGRMNGFQYNYVSQKVTYLGSDNVKILVDSIEKDLDYVRHMNPKRFDVVNIVYQPTGQYRGYDALISLHTRPEYQGVDGLVYEGATFHPSKRHAYKIAEWGNQGEITYTNHKISTYAQIDYTLSQNSFSGVAKNEYPMNGITEQEVEPPVDNPKTRVRTKRPSVMAGLDYRPWQNHVFSASYKYMGGRHDYSSHTDQIITGPGYTEDVTFNTYVKQRDVAGHSMGLFYNGSHKEWSFSANGNYYLTHNNNYSGFHRSDDIAQVTDRHYNFNGLSTNADATYQPASGKWAANFGINYDYQRMDYRDLATNALMSRNETDNVNAYISGGWFPRNNLSMGASVNVVYNKNKANREGCTTTMPLFGAWVFYNPVNWLVVRANYNSYAVTPYTEQLNPEGRFESALMWNQGNPLLRAGSNHTAKLNFGILNSLQVGGEYSWSHNGITNIYGVAEGMTPSGIDQPYVTSTPQNYTSRTWRIHATYEKTFFKHLLINGWLAYKHQYASFENMSNKGGQVSGSIQVGFVDDTFHAILQYFLSDDRWIAPQSYSRGQADIFVLVLYKSFFKGKLEVAAKYRPPLHFRSSRLDTFTDSPNYKQSTWSRQAEANDNQVILQAVWRFSSGKVVPRIERQLQSAGIN